MQTKNLRVTAAIIAAVSIATFALTGCKPLKQKGDATAETAETSSIGYDGFYSLLMHNPDFKMNPGKNSGDILWVGGTPLNANPLTYADGANVTPELWTYGEHHNDIGLTISQVSSMVQGSTETITPENSEDGAEKNVDSRKLAFCTTEGVYYIPIGYCQDTSTPVTLDYSYPEDNSLTMADIFDSGLYYSNAQISDFPNAPADDATLEEQYNFLVDYFGQPSGIYWTNASASSNGTASEEDQATNLMEFIELPRIDSDGDTKLFYLMWNYDDCWVAALCSDGVEGRMETCIEQITLIPQVTLTHAKAYVNENAQTVYDGYVGYGNVPPQMRASGETLVGRYTAKGADSEGVISNEGMANYIMPEGFSQTADDDRVYMKNNISVTVYKEPNTAYTDLLVDVATAENATDENAIIGTYDSEKNGAIRIVHTVTDGKHRYYCLNEQGTVNVELFNNGFIMTVEECTNLLKSFNF